MAQMYKVFINNKAIIFTKNEEESQDLIALNANNLSPQQLLEKLKLVSLESNDSSFIVDLQTIDFPLHDFIFLFKEKIAAGGLVVNEEKQILMILRNGMWDLPKGHQDGGESIEECALREVEEETGILRLELHEKLTTTFHHYVLNEKDVMKETHWFLMEAPSQQILKGQEDEGILKVEWVDIDEAIIRLKGSWISLLEVLHAYQNN